jgi:Intracellular proteinase inhibitor
MARKYTLSFDDLEGRRLLSGPTLNPAPIQIGDGGTVTAIPIGTVTLGPVTGWTGESVGVIFSPITATPIPVVDSMVTTNKAAYRIGQPVRITVTFRNGGTVEAALPSGKVREHITITQGSTVVWDATRPVPLGHIKTIQPGQTITFTKVWDGRPNQPGVHQLEPGTYSVNVEIGGYGSGQTIQLTPTKS